MYILERYQRQIILPEIGFHGQRILQKARILVVGAGGLAATLLPQLVGAGIGYIRLYDNDNVTLHNLHRQTLFTIDNIGKAKVTCAKQVLEKCNPDVYIDAVKQVLTVSTIQCALLNIDLVIDAADNFAITYPLSHACYVAAIPFVSASVLGRQGYVGGFCGRTAPSYYAVFPRLPTSYTACDIAGIMGPVAATLGAIQAQMALNILLNLLPSPLGCIVKCDFVNWRFNQFRFDNIKEPEQLKVHFIDQKLLLYDDCIVELRSWEEAPISVAVNVKRILLRELSVWHPPKNKRIVLVCATGMRAAQAVTMLILRGFNKLAILAANYSKIN